MAQDRDPLADFTADDSQGLLTNILAEEREGGWQMVWRLGSWAGGAIGALVAAFLAVHTSAGLQRDQIAAADVTRQSQQLQSIARESQAEARRLASAIATLNGDRDRLYARVTVLEQGLESVTGSVARQASPASLVLSSATQAVSTPPLIAAPPAVAAEEPAQPGASSPPQPAAATPPHSAPPHPAATAAKDSLPASTIYAPPDPAAPKLIAEPGPVAPAPAKAAAETTAPPEPTAVEKAVPRAAEAAPQPDRARAATLAALPEIRPADPPAPRPDVAVQRTEFGVDLGGANSIDGLRALWHGFAATKGSPVAALRPIIAIRERRNGLGLQLRLVAGPLGDAAAAARICAVLAEGNRPCETTVFDGQRLALRSPDEPAVPATPRPLRRRAVAATATHPVKRDDAPPPPPPAVAPQPPPPAPAAHSPMSGLFRSH